MGISIWQILIIAIVLVLLFGRGKISELMGDVAKGIKSFKKGMADDSEEAPAERAEGQPRTIEHTAQPKVNTAEAEESRKAS